MYAVVHKDSTLKNTIHILITFQFSWGRDLNYRGEDANFMEVVRDGFCTISELLFGTHTVFTLTHKEQEE